MDWGEIIGTMLAIIVIWYSMHLLKIAMRAGAWVGIRVYYYVNRKEPKDGAVQGTTDGDD